MAWTAQLTVLFQVAVAAVLGGLIGVEREIADKPAGFRTHMLVAGVSALLVGLSAIFVSVFRDNPQTGIDPTRIVQAIFTGLSFLGAGTIIHRGVSGQGVEGLTTAASLLLAGGIGVAVGLNQYIVAVGTTVLALVVLLGLGFLKTWIQRNRRTSA